MDVNIACIQMASQPYKWDYNIKRATLLIKEAASKGAQICVLPEVFIPGYSLTDETFRQAETLEGQTMSTLHQLARELNIYITGSITEKFARDFYNTMFMLSPQGLLGTYRKIHVFSFEQKYWKPGKNTTIIDTEFGTVGLGICADMHYPKLWKQYAGKVDLVLICSAWPTKPTGTALHYAIHEENLCKDLPLQISTVLRVPTAYCNACHPCLGKLPFGLGTMTCQGYSKIIDKGTVVASIDSQEEKIIQATVQIAEDRIIPDNSAFKNWITYPIREKFPKFITEKFTLIYAKIYYHFHKKKYLK